MIENLLDKYGIKYSCIDAHTYVLDGMIHDRSIDTRLVTAPDNFEIDIGNLGTLMKVEDQALSSRVVADLAEKFIVAVKNDNIKIYEHRILNRALYKIIDVSKIEPLKQYTSVGSAILFKVTDGVYLGKYRLTQ